MQLPPSHNDANKPDAEKASSRNSAANSLPNPSSSALRNKAEARAGRRLDDYFQQARAEGQSLLDEQALQRLTAQRESASSGHSLWRSARRAFLAQKRYVVSLAFVGVICGAIGFMTADIVERNVERYMEKFSRLLGLNFSAQNDNGEEFLVADTTTALPLQALRARDGATALRSRKSPKTARATKATVEAAAEPFMNAVPGIPQNISHDIQPTRFVTLSVKEFERLGFFISKDGLVEIAYPLAKKDGEPAEKKPHAVFASFRIDERWSLREIKHPLNAPISALSPAIASAISRGGAHLYLRPFAITDTLGSLPSALSSRYWESQAREELKHWSAIFEDMSSDESSRHKNADFATTLIALRLQVPVGANPALRNLVVWYKTSPRLIAALPERVQEHMKTEMTVLAFAHGPSNAAREAKERNASGVSSAYYLAQTQALLPNVITLQTAIARAQAGKSFATSYFLHEPRAVAIALYSIDGTLIQEWVAASAQSGQCRSHIFMSERVSPGIYLLAFKTDRHETAIQHIYLE
jgi:hypothetical protein